MIEDAKSLSRIAVDVEDTEFLSGSRSSTGLSYFFANAEFAGREHHNTPGIWEPGRAVALRTLLPDATGERIDDVANLLGAGHSKFV